MGCFFHKWEIVAVLNMPVTVISVIFRKSWSDSILYEFDDCKKCGARRVTTKDHTRALEFSDGRELQINWVNLSKLPDGAVTAEKESV